MECNSLMGSDEGVIDVTTSSATWDKFLVITKLCWKMVEALLSDPGQPLSRSPGEPCSKLLRSEDTFFLALALLLTLSGACNTGGGREGLVEILPYPLGMFTIEKKKTN